MNETRGEGGESGALPPSADPVVIGEDGRAGVMGGTAPALPGDPVIIPLPRGTPGPAADGRRGAPAGGYVVAGEDGRMTLVPGPAPAEPGAAPPAPAGDRVVIGDDGSMVLVQGAGGSAPAGAPVVIPLSRAPGASAAGGEPVIIPLAPGTAAAAPRVPHAPPAGGYVVMGDDGRMTAVPGSPAAPAGDRVVVGDDGTMVLVQGASSAEEAAAPRVIPLSRAPGAPAAAPTPMPVAGPVGDGGAAARVGEAEGPHSQELEEIIGYAPGWLVRWGISCIAVVLVLLLGLSWIVRYPEVVKGHATVTTPTPPVRVVARTGAQIGELRVADGQRVRAGSVLAVLENPASTADVLAVATWAASLDPAAPAPAAPPPAGALGEVQDAHAELLRTLSDLRAFEAGGYQVEKIAALSGQLRDHQRLHETLQRQQAILEQELALAAAERDRSRELARRNLLSTAEMELVEQRYLQKRYAVEQGTNGTVNNQIQIAAQRTALLDLQGSRGEERRRLELAVRAALAALRTALAGWEQSYLLRAPAAGRVTFFTPLTERQYVSASEPVMAVVPDSGAVLARVRVGPEGAGRVLVGHKVHLAFDSYPRSEYGVVEGRVRRVSLVGFRERGTERTEHLVEVEMPAGLRTSYGKQIPFRQEMEAQAEIVTEDLRLIERIFNQFRGLASRR